MQALILIDMQRDFFDPAPLRERLTELVARTSDLVAKAEAADVPVVVIRTVHSPDGDTWALNMREDRQAMAVEGTEGAQLVDGLAFRQPIEIHKTRDSAFLGTRLESTLRDLGADQLVLAGVSTEACVAITAAEAYARDFKVVLAGDAIASAQPECHQPALDWLETQYRQPTRSNDEIVFDTSAAQG